jgi:hypothetical protein
MAGRTTRRALAVGALATVLVGTTGSPATAAPPTLTTLRSAGVIMTDPDPAGVGAFVTFDVFAPPGEDAFGVGEVFVLGYECLADERAPATITGLRTATSTGTVPLTCGSATAPPEGLPGQAVVELAWAGEGAVQRSTTVDRDRRCVIRSATRQARVTGSVRVTVPALGVDVTVTVPADGAAIREERSLCLRPA